jgi:small subunit ribosomal protein S16
VVRIRLRRTGARNAACYKVVVADSRSPRDGRFLEDIGSYNPRTNPPEVNIKEDRALMWLKRGAQPSEAAHALLRRVGILETYERERDEARRQAEPEA